MFERVAPIFPVRDLDGALEFYARLGFDVRRYTGGGYGYVTRDGVELHLGEVADPDRHRASAYLHVGDAGAVATAWRAAGAEIHGPQDTPWGRHEGAMVDPDGNVVRFGSGIPAGAQSAP